MWVRGLASGRRGERGAGRDPDGGGEAYDLGDIVDVADPDNVVLTLLVVVRGVLVLVGDGSGGQEGGSEDCGLHDDDDDDRGALGCGGVEPVLNEPLAVLI